MGCEIHWQQRLHLLRAMANAWSNGLLTGPGGLREQFLRPAPSADVREWVTEEPTGLLNQYGRPIFRVRRIVSQGAVR